MKEYGRHIGKLVHSNPVVAFSIIIEQLESYNNQIPCFVDATRYLTELEFDILSFCILEALASEKSRIQPNGTTIEKWLVSLSTLCGSIWKKPQIDLLGLLSYLSKQLTLNNIYDMAILQELLGQMTGIVAVEEPTESQLLAYGGGYKLKREVLAFESVRSTKKPTARLTAALGDSGLMGPMGILMAQQKREIVFNTESRELKILGWNYDLVSGGDGVI